MKNIFTLGVMPLLLTGFVISCGNPADKIDQNASRTASVDYTDTDTTTLPAGGTIGNVSSSAAFTAGAGSTINGYIKAVGAVTLGANVKAYGDIDSGGEFNLGANGLAIGNVNAGAAFNLGANGLVIGNVNAAAAVTLGANAQIIGNVHSGIGVITLGAGATITAPTASMSPSVSAADGTDTTTLDPGMTIGER